MEEKDVILQIENSAENGEDGAGGPEPIPLPPPREILRASLENMRNFWSDWFKGSKGRGKNWEIPLGINLTGPVPPSLPPITGRGLASPPPVGLGVTHGSRGHNLTVSQGESQIVTHGRRRHDLTVSQGESQIVEHGQIEWHGKQRVGPNFPQIADNESEFSTHGTFEDNSENSQNFAENSGVRQGAQNFGNLQNQFFSENDDSRDGSQIGEKPPLEITYKETSEIDPNTGLPRKIPFFYFEEEPPGSEFGQPLAGQVRRGNGNYEMRNQENFNPPQEIGTDSRNFESVENTDLEQLGLTEQDLEDERKFLDRYYVSGHSDFFSEYPPLPTTRVHEWRGEEGNI